MMDMKSRNQYLFTLVSKAGGYHLSSRKQKTKILDEYCKTTGQNRKYVIRKIRKGTYIKSIQRDLKEPGKKRVRKSIYDKEVTFYLIKLWDIFDRPCGQRLAPLLRTEVDRLRRLGELLCSEKMALKLKAISPSEIDRSLKPHKEKECLKQKYNRKLHPLLYQKIPVKIASEQDRAIPGSIQVDLVEHCGASAAEPFIHTTSSTDLATGWWEGETLLRRGMKATAQSLDLARSRYPFPWQSIHVDNDSSFINWILYGYTKEHGFDLSRSRPYKKNDNYLIEQKNWTHVRKIVGYLRYDTKRELEILNDLYRNELRLFKNFFQPVIMLVGKERCGGKIRRRYDAPKTPFQRVLESPNISEESKQSLRKIYESLNPAELKRVIEAKIDLLYQTHNSKSINTKVRVETIPSSVTFLYDPTNRISVT